MDNFEEFCFHSETGSFMQSKNWKRVKTNWKSETVEIENENGDIAATALLLIKKIPLIKAAFIYCPRGPVCDYHNIELLKEVFSKIHAAAKKYGAFSLKIDPLIDENDQTAINNLKSLGFVYHGERAGYDNIQCKENYVLDLDGSIEEFFAGFKPKHRYNIRIAEKKGVRCEICGKEKLPQFYELMKETASRDGFAVRSIKYYERMLGAFPNSSGLCLCFFGDKLLSGALFVFYGERISYIYGCSSSENRNLMPCYKMHSELIKFAVENKLKIYDFGGIPYWYDETHKNYGVYRFKKGFGGRIVTYAGEFDYIYRRKFVKLFSCALKKRKCI